MPDNTVIFDVQAALTRLMENKNLYRKLLQRFESEYNDYDEQIKRAVASGDVEEATRMAHTHSRGSRETWVRTASPRQAVSWKKPSGKGRCRPI